ncbi:MAG: flavin reductase family protein [ANME-2 cluster archaeon]|nr:flavin reductase family protein [ANME-2 cluster archaeon]
MKKRSIPITKANYLINHGPTVLITSGTEERDNIMTLAWQMPASGNPVRLAISVAPERFSHELITQGKAFGVNLPTIQLYKTVLLCGSQSGREIDKFKRSGLTRMAAKKIPCPLIRECVAHIECRLVNAWNAGDHTIFLGEVVAACADEDAFNSHLQLNNNIQTLHHMGGPYFAHPLGVKELTI